jgi:hypothetical protein
MVSQPFPLNRYHIKPARNIHGNPVLHPEIVRRAADSSPFIRIHRLLRQSGSSVFPVLYLCENKALLSFRLIPRNQVNFPRPASKILPKNQISLLLQISGRKNLIS